ncbi:hypothetical protein [Neisseria bergeri]|nr:hypothetical protein [Neisseria bergeri]
MFDGKAFAAAVGGNVGQCAAGGEDERDEEEQDFYGGFCFVLNEF